tara:strand:+ start:850 stop:1503 length:654 start_codon:yes stop_codon:yes gene_type:complete
MKVTINIPESLSEITLEQYQRWHKVSNNNEDENFLKQKMIEIFCNVSLKDILTIKPRHINAIVEELKKVFEDKPALIQRFIYKDIEFGFIPKLDDMSFGEYIDLDTYLPEWETMHNAMNILYRPVIYSKKNKYLIESYQGSDVYDMREIPLNVVFSALVFFWNLKKELLSHMGSYLAKQKEVKLPAQVMDFLRNGVGINQSMDWLKEMSESSMKLQS